LFGVDEDDESEDDESGDNESEDNEGGGGGGGGDHLGQENTIDILLPRDREDLRHDILRRWNDSGFVTRLPPTWSTELVKSCMTELNKNDGVTFQHPTDNPKKDNSFFQAMSRALKAHLGEEKSADDIRAEVSKFLQESGHETYFQYPGMAADAPLLSLKAVYEALAARSEDTWEKYCTRVGMEGSTASSIELIAVMHLYSLNVCLFHGHYHNYVPVDNNEYWQTGAIMDRWGNVARVLQASCNTREVTLGFLRTGVDIYVNLEDPRMKLTPTPLYA
jgi:hypothetical protein